MNCEPKAVYRTGVVTIWAAVKPLPIAGDNVQQVIYTQSKLKVLSIERVLLVVETDPKEGLQRLGEQVNSAGVGPSRNALQDQESLIFLDETFRPRLTNGQKRPQDIPPI
jgi:hypothetical protein